MAAHSSGTVRDLHPCSLLIAYTPREMVAGEPLALVSIHSMTILRFTPNIWNDMQR